MAKLPSFKRIIIEDFQEKDRPLISKLAYSINIAFEDILNAFNKNLTVVDNLNINQKSITISVDINGAPISNQVVKSGLSSLCTGISVIKAINNTNPSLSPTQAPFITFIDNSGQITISKITGLQVNNNYTLQLILWA